MWYGLSRREPAPQTGFLENIDIPNYQHSRKTLKNNYSCNLGKNPLEKPLTALYLIFTLSMWYNTASLRGQSR